VAAVEELLDLWRRRHHVVAFTGAGVSTLSGIPDFRGPDGIYRQIDGDLVFDLAVFQRDPAVFFTHGRDLVYGAAAAEPSLVHAECARLEACGRLAAVVTQNIDMLHGRAGSRHVIELHGSPAWHTCLGCGRQVTFAAVRARVAAGGVPRCDDCRGVLKPDITFFGEMLPDGALEAALAEAARCDLMLVLGSSLLVQPAASVPLAAVRSGADLVIVNRDPTPLDRHATLRHDDLATVFGAISRALR
jgi:NAD-dependent deacetylase